MSQTMDWHVEEVFKFPLELGSVKEGKSINVRVNWEKEQLNNAIRIQGIYHITAKVQFGLEAQPQSAEGTFIEHIDLADDEGYFEYALPFRLELPNIELKDLRVEDIQTTCQDVLRIGWQVVCVYEELTVTDDVQDETLYIEEPKLELKESTNVKMKEESAPEIVEAFVESPMEQLVEEYVEETVKESTEFLFQLEDSYRKQSVPLNNIRQE
ncbi:hypothetical protein [Lysinibacillus sp. LZ02]|uniref:hypothetical protein n=1 Tax=Lysinibacillus sp. LZ02 TaxID=3420668 RepID=UPI003D367946